MSNLLKLIEKCNTALLSGTLNSSKNKPFFLKGTQIGLIPSNITKALKNYPDVFQITENHIKLNPTLNHIEERTREVDYILQDLREKNIFAALNGWRNEQFDVKKTLNSETLFKMERSAGQLFGLKKYGVNINGYVKNSKEVQLWLQKRSVTKATWPGYWDNIVGGLIPADHGVFESVFKEAQEEASIPKKLLGRLKCTGCVTFYYESETGLFPYTEFVFDLELPNDFYPKNDDGEVDCFHLFSVKQCFEKLFSEDFMITKVPITVDFLIRHGFITPENEKDYLRILELLHVPISTIY